MSAGKLAEARLAPEIALLGNGKVLVLGDDGCSPEYEGGTSSSVAAWAASTNRWQTAARLTSARARFVALPLRDGRVLVAGGLSSRSGSHNYAPFQSFSSAWAYDARTGGWSRAGLMKEARGDPIGAVLDDGRVLVAGGYYASGSDPYGASTDLAPMTASAIQLVVAPAVLADMDPPDPPDAPVLSTAELFDPRTNTWSATGRMSFGRFGSSAVTLADGRVLVVGQRDISRTGDNMLRWDQRALTVAEIYDPRTGRFRLAGTLPTPIVNASLVALPDGGALLIGGRSAGSDDAVPPLRTTLRFDPKRLSWAATGSLATGRSSAVAVRLRDGHVLVAGGFDAYGPTRTVETYDPSTGRWTPAAAMPAPRGGAVGVLLRDGSVLVVGGFGAHGHDVAGWASCTGLDQAVRYVPGS